MAVKRFGEGAGAVLIRVCTVYGNYCERDARTWVEGSAGKDLFETTPEGPGMLEAGGVLPSPRARR